MPRRKKDPLPRAAAEIISARPSECADRRRFSRSLQGDAGRALAAGDPRKALDLIRAWRALMAASREAHEFRNFERQERNKAKYRRDSARERRIRPFD